MFSGCYGLFIRGSGEDRLSYPHPVANPTACSFWIFHFSLPTRLDVTTSPLARFILGAGFCGAQPPELCCNNLISTMDGSAVRAKGAGSPGTTKGTPMVVTHLTSGKFALVIFSSNQRSSADI
jgi:hypothetical protein